VGLVFSALYGLLDVFLDGSLCSYECDSMRLGALTKYMHIRGIHSPLPEAPFHGFSLAIIVRIVRNFREPRWCNEPSGYSSSHCSHHSCSIMSEIDPIIASLENSAQGLMLEEFTGEKGNNGSRGNEENANTAKAAL